jgi:uncharacterized protein YyaL (SSP411 family)
MLRLKTLSILILSLVFSYGQQKKSAVRFDNSLSYIQYEYSSDDMDFYSVKDIKNNPPKNNMPIFSVSTLDATNEIDSKNYIEFQKNNDAKNGKKILKTIIHDTIINGNKFYSMTIEEINEKTKESQTNLYGFSIKNNNAVVFLGSDMGKYEYFYTLIETFYSMRF